MIVDPTERSKKRERERVLCIVVLVYKARLGKPYLMQIYLDLT